MVHREYEKEKGSRWYIPFGLFILPTVQGRMACFLLLGTIDKSFDEQGGAGQSQGIQKLAVKEQYPEMGACLCRRRFHQREDSLLPQREKDQ